tara:strand:+ start:1971 stop:2129 length:159 start_codon:yes stop_codon:yes gene_type:complete
MHLLIPATNIVEGIIIILISAWCFKQAIHLIEGKPLENPFEILNSLRGKTKK